MKDVFENDSMEHKVKLVPMGRKVLGNFGELISALYLQAEGCLILERQYHTRYGEIDIIAQDADNLVFVEVKTRRNLQYGTGSEAVDYRKQQRIRMTALAYLKACTLKRKEKNKSAYQALRFDVIEVYLYASRRIVLNHYKNCF